MAKGAPLHLLIGGVAGNAWAREGSPASGRALSDTLPDVRFQAPCARAGLPVSGGRFPPPRPEPAARPLGGVRALGGARRRDAGSLDGRRRRLARGTRSSRLTLGGGVLHHRVHLAAEDEREAA